MGDGRLLDLYAGAPADPAPAAALDGAATAPASAPATSDWLTALWEGFPRAVRERYVPRGAIGEGGMGVVVEAEDRELRRVVAIKGVRDPRGITAEARVRHVREARIAARLTHPNIVPVFDTWTDARGNRWCSMLRVPGETPTLARWLAARDPAEGPEQRLNRVTQVFLQVCRAITYAHGQSVLHRDLKSENVLIGPTGEALVADWGVAAAFSEAATGEIVGTPGCSAPEQLGQLGAARADARSDIYALGVLLCELLSGGAAFEAARRAGAPPADALPPRTPRELVAVARRATAREPAARFADVPALSGAIEAYLAGELVEGLTYTPVERAVRWLRAHALAVAIGVALLAVGGQAVFSSQRATALLRETNRALALSEADLATGVLEGGQLALARHHAAIAAKARARAAPDQVPPRPRAAALLYDLPRPDRLIWACTLEQPAEVARFTPGDDGIVAGSRALSLWTFPFDGRRGTGGVTPRGMVWGVDIHPGAGLAATAGAKGDVELFELATGKSLGVIAAHKEPLWALAFSPDGHRLATGSFDKTVRIWDLANRASPPVVFSGHASQVWTIAWSRDGRYLASGGADVNDLRVWDTTTRALVASLPGPEQMMALAFDHTGELLAAGSGALTTPVFRWRTGALVTQVPAPRVQSLAFNDQGVLATGGQDNIARLWTLDLKEGAAREQLALRGHTRWISMVSFTHKGDYLVTAAQDKTVRLWDVRPKLDEPLASGPRPELLTFTRDGRGLVIADQDSLREYDAVDGRPGAAVPLPGCPARALHFDAPGEGAAVLLTGDRLVLQRFHDHHQEGPPVPLMGGGSQSVAEFDSAGKRVVVVSQSGPGAVFALDPFKRLRDIASAPVSWRGVALDPGGRWVATAGADANIHLWSLTDDAHRIFPRDVEGKTGHSEGVTSLTFSRDGRWLASGGQDFKLRVWDVETGKSREVGDHGDDHVWAVCFDADARLVVGGGPAGLLMLHDVVSGSVVDEFQTSSEAVTCLALSPDGTRLAAGGSGRAALYDLAAWREPNRHLAAIIDASVFGDDKEKGLAPRKAAVQIPVRLAR